MALAAITGFPGAIKEKKIVTLVVVCNPSHVLERSRSTQLQRNKTLNEVELKENELHSWWACPVLVRSFLLALPGSGGSSRE